MARFRGTVKGNRKEVSRSGHSILVTENNGWNQGVEVIAFVKDDKDAHTISMNGGSHGRGGARFLGTIVDGESIPGPYIVELVKGHL